MTVAEIGTLLRRQGILIVAFALIGISVGAIVSMLSPTTYESSTRVFVSVQADEGAGAQERSAGNRLISQSMGSYLEIMTSPLVLGPVVQDLGLTITAGELANSVQASTRPGSAVIDITVSDENPGRAARIADAVADGFGMAVANTLENRGGNDGENVRAVQVQPAPIPSQPSNFSLVVWAAIGGVVGLGAGIGLALLRTVLDTRVRTASDLEEAVEAPVVGRISRDERVVEAPVAGAFAAGDPLAEEFRGLRTNVDFLIPRGEVGSVVVTSAGPGEGKTTTSANLAIACAEAGKKVLLIDADMRKPRIASYMGIEGGVGLSDVLVARARINDVMQQWGDRALFVLASGRVPPNPSELLGSVAMERLIADAREAFDIIIVDAPPVLLVTDAALAARYTTGVLLVSSIGKTTIPGARAAAERIHSAGAQVLGTVATMVPIQQSERSAYGAYAASPVAG